MALEEEVPWGRVIAGHCRKEAMGRMGMHRAPRTSLDTNQDL